MPRKYLVLLAVCLATLTINLSTMIVNIALPSLAVELDASTKELLWIVDAYNLSFAALVLAMGSLSDRFGRRPALILGLVGFAVSSSAAALVDSSSALIGIRFVMGVFAAVIFPTTLSIIANTFTNRRERASALGLWGASVGLGVALGPVIGGVVLTYHSWHSVFWALVPVTVVTIVMAVAFVPESRDPSVPRIDRYGFVISVAALGTLIYTIIEGPERGWDSAPTLGGFTAAAVLIVGFILVERAVEHPMIDVTLFLDRRFSAACAAVTIAFFALFGFVFLITQFFQFVRDYSPAETGFRFLPVALALAVASIAGGQLAPRIGTKLVVAPGLALLGVAFLWISQVTADVSYPTIVVPQMLLLGVGIGLISTPATESILRVLPPARAGVGSAVNDATREFGGTLGVAVVGSLFASQYSASLAAGLQGRVAEDVLARATESVGFADAATAQVPGLAQVVDAAFIDGLNLSCIVVGILCLLGALAGLVALPGDRYDPDAVVDLSPDDDATVTTGDAR